MRIVNPAGGSGYTTLKSAGDYVRSGRARWAVDERGRRAIEFNANYRHASVMRESRIPYDIVAGSAMATEEELSNTPVSNPAELLGRGE